MAVHDLDVVVGDRRLQGGHAEDRRDEQIVLLEDVGDLRVHLALDLERAVEADGRPGRILGKRDRVRGHEVAVLGQGLPDETAEDGGEVGPSGLAHVVHVQLEADVLDVRAEVAEHAGSVTQVVADLSVYLEAAEVRVHRDPQPLHAGQLRGDRELGAQRDDVIAMRTRHHVLQQAAIGDRPRHGPVVAVMVEVERRVLRHAAIGGLEPDHAAERRRDADRAADVGSGREAGHARCQRCRRAAGGASGAVLEVPGIARDAPEPRVGDRRAAELGRRRTGVDDAPGSR